VADDAFDSVAERVVCLVGPLSADGDRSRRADTVPGMPVQRPPRPALVAWPGENVIGPSQRACTAAI
jgi:hypothetical protein